MIIKIIIIKNKLCHITKREVLWNIGKWFRSNLNLIKQPYRRQIIEVLIFQVEPIMFKIWLFNV